jgi:pimeloyl-[acyl-carrier protein] methyl ester esterase
MPVERIIILPGMDGTGKLLLEFMHALPARLRKEIMVYPKGAVLSYEQLENMARWQFEDSPPFALVAESFSSPMAIRIAAEQPKNLLGVVLCVGFATSPLRGAKRWIASALAPLVMRVQLPESAIREWLLGLDAPSDLVDTAREVIASVKPAVLSARLRAVLSCDVREDLRKIDLPMLYLQARQDRLLGPRSLEEIRTIRPEVRAVVLDGPHFLLQREPLQVSKIVAEFLATLS